MLILHHVSILTSLGLPTLLGHCVKSLPLDTSSGKAIPQSASLNPAIPSLSTVGAMVTTRSMSKSSCDSLVHAHSPTIVREPDLRSPTPWITDEDQLDGYEPNITVLPRTGIKAGIFDTLQDVVIDHCETVIDDLREQLLSIDGGREHRAVDVLSSAMKMVHSQVYGSRGRASKIVPLVSLHILPELTEISRVLSEKKAQWSCTVEGTQNLAGVESALLEAGKAILFFEGLIQDVAEHYHVVTG